MQSNDLLKILNAFPTHDIESDLEENSEKEYLKTVNKIVDKSIEQLNEQNNSKKDLRTKFFKIFASLIFIQLGFIILLIILQGSVKEFNVDTAVIVAVISSVFVETLGAVILMIKFCFDSKQEVSILEILKGVVEHFQKYKKK